VLRCGLVAGEDLVEPGQRLVVEGDVQGPRRGVEVCLGARIDDRRGDRRLVQQPGQRDVARLGVELVGEVLVGLDLR